MPELFFFFLFLPTSLFGEEPSYPEGETVPTLPPLTIQAPRDPLELQRKISIVDEIPRGEIPSSHSLGEGVEKSPASLSRTYSGPGSLQGISLRGLSPSHTLLVVDGVPLRFPLSGLVNLSLLPPFLFEEIQVLRGGGAHLYGGSAMGGVVFLNTIPRKTHLSGEIGAGSFGGWKGGAGYGDPEKGTLKVFGEGWKGNYPYLDPERKTVKRRENNGSTLFSVAGGVSLALSSKIETETFFYGSFLEKEVPGSIKTPTPFGLERDRFYRIHSRLSLPSYENTTFLGGIYLDQEEVFYRDGVFVPLTSPSLSRGYTGGGYLQMNFQKGEFVVDLFSERRKEWGLLPAGFRPERDLFGTGVLFGYIKDLYGAVGTVRTEKIFGEFLIVTPSLGGYLKPIPPVTFKGEIHQGFREPTFNDLYWPPSALAVGNPHLRPEQSTGGGFFIEGEREGTLSFLTSAGYFREEIRDLILWSPQGGIWSPENIGKVRSEGGELFGKVRFPLPFLKGAYGKGEGGYTYGRVQNLDPTLLEDLKTLRNRLTTCPLSRGNPQVPLSPLHRGRGEAGVETLWFFVGGGVRYVGKRPTDKTNTNCLPSFGTAFLAGEIKITKELSLRWEGSNITNQAYEEIPGYPAPSRSFWIFLLYSTKPYPKKGG
jgi:outer membrane cobalamin receptor